ncbi:MAG: phenylalanine--tRNA ligase subunit beta [Armatimonadetes bacterium]|nr:phenylalanine--tRNA ligase subunit beta [Armatimonadota bacterium]
MKFPYQMLLDYVQTSLDAEGIGDLLTMAGFELEGIEEVDGDKVLDIKVMSNRGDGLSVFGLSREVLAKDPKSSPTKLYEAAVAGFPGDEWPVMSPSPITIESKECNRFCGLVLENAGNGSTPDWMQKRLKQAGMRPISLLVDLTNYIVLELGRPMHAFDFDKLKGNRIVVRQAKAGEKLTTLNGDEHELKPDQMMVCDAEHPVGAPGVMGGLETEISESTTRVFVESAHFLNTAVRKLRKQLGLNTDASYRFERSVDPESCLQGLRRFHQLLQEAGVSPKVVGFADEYPNKPQTPTVNVRVSRANLLLGMPVTAAEAKGYLERLGMKVSGDGEPFSVQIPTWRPDLVQENDLVEEIGRIHGYDRIPTRLPHGTTLVSGTFGIEAFIDRVREEVVRAGFTQIISHSLRDVHPLDANGKRIMPRNPASPEAAYLRNALWPCLADAARRNQGEGLALFEIGRTFTANGERQELAVMTVGELLPVHWVKSQSPEADFYSLKQALLDICHQAGVTASVVAPKSSDPRLHPYQQAELHGEGGAFGLFGRIHPTAAEESSLSPDTVLATIDLERMFASRRDDIHLKPISRNPAVRRDIAILVDEAVPFASIEQTIGKALGGELERMWLFDVYKGKGIPEGKHSLAVALQLRKLGENFTDEEANQARDRAVQALASLGATIR